MSTRIAAGAALAAALTPGCDPPPPEIATCSATSPTTWAG